MLNPEIPPCPFCGWAPQNDDDLADVLYPSGNWWADHLIYGKVYRTFRRHAEREEGDKPCWWFQCPEHMGGCGAKIEGCSEGDVMQKWTRRVA